ncbi:MAG: DUF4442 domain-containing protein [Acidimicrobiales bacterium]
MTRIDTPETDAARAMAEGAKSIPFNALMDLRTIAAAPGHFEVALPEREDLLNHVGAVHAVPILAPAEMASGCALATAMADAIAEGLAPIAKSLRVRYRKPAKGQLTAAADVEPGALASAIEAARQRGRADLELPVQVCDPEGQVVAEVVVEWAIRRL